MQEVHKLREDKIDLQSLLIKKDSLIDELTLQLGSLQG